MKKSIFIISMLMFIYLGTSAQPNPFGNMSIFIDLYNDFTPLVELDESLLFTNYHTLNWGNTFYFYTLNRETHALTQKHLGYGVSNPFTMYREEIVTNIQIVNNYKAKTLSYIKAEAPAMAMPDELKYEEIKSIPYNSDDYRFTSAVSPDRSKYCSMIKFYDKNELKKFYIIVFDNEGNILWEKTEDYTINAKDVYAFTGDTRYEFMNTFISNDGKIYVVYRTYDEWSKEEKKDIFLKRDALLSENNFKVTSITVLLFSENEFYQQVENTDFGKIQSFEACLTKEGDIFLGGYFANPNNIKKTTGIFSLLFNKKLDLVSKKISHLEADFMPDNFFGYEEEIMGKYDFVTRASGIHELENGNFVMLSEQIFMRGDENFIKNIVANTFLKDGSLIKTTVIPNALDIEDSYPSLSKYMRIYSFSSFCEGNDIYIFYNGNKKNFVEPEEKWFTLDENKYKSCTVLLTKLSEDGNYQTKMVLPAFKKPYLIHSAFAHNDKTAYVLLYLGNGYFKFDTLDYVIF